MYSDRDYLRYIYDIAIRRAEDKIHNLISLKKNVAMLISGEHILVSPASADHCAMESLIALARKSDIETREARVYAFWCNCCDKCIDSLIQSEVQQVVCIEDFADHFREKNKKANRNLLRRLQDHQISYKNISIKLDDFRIIFDNKKFII